MKRHTKDSLVSSILLDDVFMNMRAEAVAHFIASLPNEEKLVLYGCGTIARILAMQHAEELTKANVIFATTDAPRENTFHGFPWTKASQIPLDTSKVLLLSATYEDAMCEEIGFLHNTDVIFLKQALTEGINESLLTKALQHVSHEMDNVLQCLADRFSDDDDVICFLDPDLSMPYLEMYASMRKAGKKLVLLSRSHVPSKIPYDKMEEYGFADFFYEAPSLHYLWVMIPRLLQKANFSIVNAWCLYYTFSIFNHVIETSKAPVVVWLDSILSQVVQVDGARQHLLEEQGIDEKRATALEKTLSHRAAGLVSRIPTQMIDKMKEQHESKVPSLLFYRPLLPIEAPVQRTHESNRPPKVIFVCSLHTRPDVTLNIGWPLESIYEPIEVFTNQGIEFHIFNPLDVGGGYGTLREMDRKNHLLHYSGAIHPEDLLQEIADSDYLWLGRRVPPCPSGYHETHLPLTIFQAVSAGTPVIVSSELSSLAQLVTDFNLGFVLASEDWKNVRKHMEAFDYETSLQDIKEFRKSLSPERMALRLTDFYETIHRSER
ncbi:glycosyltransferase [Desulfovibrio inopinatus]|uniref:glycosyltransferase n=1 Tax=Desulfovibrio inopinatus TaxID=102109 RepID=UPI0004011DEB|nr:glycosyltransferase [Desulfovibrio inopinatus]